MMSLKLRRIWVQLTSDRKRFGVLCAVAGVGLLLWARLIVVSNMPRTAVADEAAPAQAKAASGKSKGRDAASSGAAAPVKLVRRAPVDVALHDAPAHDPFVISPVHFPRPAQPASMASEAGKSRAEPVEDPQQAEARRVALLREVAGKLKLEAAMAGAALAVIDGKSYRLGDTIASPGNAQVTFTLTDVRHRSVILECQGVRFELRMTLPGG